MAAGLIASTAVTLAAENAVPAHSTDTGAIS
jgi:hypothetical protein